IREGPEYTRVVFDVSGSLQYKLFALENPDRTVLDIEAGRLAAGFATPKMDGRLRGVRTGVQNGKGLRVVFDLAEGVKPKSFLLPPADKMGYRLVLDLTPVAVATKPVARTVEQAV